LQLSTLVLVVSFFYKSLQQHLPFENIDYFADSAFFPFGNKSPQALQRRLEKWISFFHRKKYKALIIACHTLSAVYQKSALSMPFIIHSLDALDKYSGHAQTIIWATPLFAQLSSYTNVLPCPNLAKEIEMGVCDITQQLAYSKEKKATSIILGCSHYNAIKESMEKEFLVIDPLTTLLQTTIQYLQKNSLLHFHQKDSLDHFYVTKDKSSFIRHAQYADVDVTETEKLLLF